MYYNDRDVLMFYCDNLVFNSVFNSVLLPAQIRLGFQVSKTYKTVEVDLSDKNSSLHLAFVDIK